MQPRAKHTAYLMKTETYCFIRISRYFFNIKIIRKIICITLFYQKRIIIIMLEVRLLYDLTQSEKFEILIFPQQLLKNRNCRCNHLRNINAP